MEQGACGTLAGPRDQPARLTPSVHLQVPHERQGVVSHVPGDVSVSRPYGGKVIVQGFPTETLQRTLQFQLISYSSYLLLKLSYTFH